jgi:hypothetical protein
MYGWLSELQKKVLANHVCGRTVWDMGAGDCILAQDLLDLGARRIRAVDKEPLVSELDERVEYTQAYFKDLPVEERGVLFLSWPINRKDPALVDHVAAAQIVVYLGSNMDNNACGSPDLFDHLVCRELLAHVPERKNTLLIYGGPIPRRELVPEELAALDQSVVYNFHKEYGGFVAQELVELRAEIEILKGQVGVLSAALVLISREQEQEEVRARDFWSDLRPRMWKDRNGLVQFRVLPPAPPEGETFWARLKKA